MLVELRIENLGIIEELQVVLEPGLTAITGETGAGKTLVVEALELLAGARADATLVRPGAAEARVEGRFEDPLTGEEIVVARAVPADGRSRAYVDGRLATVAELADLGARLIDLHGQHAHQSLLVPAMQRAVLDTFAGPPALGGPRRVPGRSSAAAARSRRRWRDSAATPATRAREISLLEYQIDEIDGGGPRATRTRPRCREAEEEALTGAAEDREALLAAHETVDGRAVDAVGVASRGGSAARVVRRAGRAGPKRSRPSSPRSRTTCASRPRPWSRIPSGWTRCSERRRLLRDLQRKYGDTIAEVLDAPRRGRGAPRRARGLRGADRRARGGRARAEAETATAAAAGCTTRAPRLRTRSPRPCRIGSSGSRCRTARLSVLVEPGEPGEDGADRVVFLLAANAGEPAQPLAKVASGGELSRAMLGLRVALAERGDTGRGPVLVFDEVDAGIGGEAGAAVGRELAALARSAQVLCITHLAQVAACADAQIVVRKAEQRRPDHGDRAAGAERGPGGGALPDARGRGGLRSRPSTRGGALERGHDERGRQRPSHAVTARDRRADGAAGRAAARHKGAAPDVVTGRRGSTSGPRTSSRRMQPGDIAVINHTDIDRVAAEGLIARGRGGGGQRGRVDLRAVPERRPDPHRRGRDPARSTTSAPRSWTAIGEGDELRVVGGEVWRGDELVVTGTLLDARAIEAAMEDGAAATSAPSSRSSPRTRSSTSSARRSSRSSRSSCRRCAREIKGRHALVVVRGHDYRSDLAALKPYLREYQPVLIGVDGGADALLEIGFKPDIIIGDFDSVSDRALRCGAELIHHVHLDGRAPGRENLLEWGVPYEEFVIDGTSEDVAMLLAYEAGAQLIVAVGTHATMVEFLDKGRRGMSSTFLTRLRLGPVLVDAKGVSRLYEGRVRRRDMVALVVSRAPRHGRDQRGGRADPRVPRRDPGHAQGPLVLRHRRLTPTSLALD